MNARGGSNDFLWISEWGPIQLDDPRRSAEIRSGALPSARHGTIVIETTDEARYAALRRFGNVSLAKEESREIWGWIWLDPCATSGTGRSSDRITSRGVMLTIENSDYDTKAESSCFSHSNCQRAC